MWQLPDTRAAGMLASISPQKRGLQTFKPKLADSTTSIGKHEDQHDLTSNHILGFYHQNNLQNRDKII